MTEEKTLAEEGIEELDYDIIEASPMTTDEAFASAMRPNIFADIKLFPFSLQRRALWGELVGKGASVFTWSLFCAWVCSRSAEEIYAATADRPRAQAEAFAWAESKGITLENSGPVLELFAKIDAELFASTQVREDDSQPRKPENPNAGGPPE